MKKAINTILDQVRNVEITGIYMQVAVGLDRISRGYIEGTLIIYENGYTQIWRLIDNGDKASHELSNSRTFVQGNEFGLT